MMCECGNPRPRWTRDCERCGFLDGRRPIQAAVISALRECPDDINQISMQVYGKLTKDTQTALLRTLQGLEKMGRVRRDWRAEVVSGHGGSRGRWMWSLCEQQRRAA
jgi:hypothetical protein